MDFTVENDQTLPGFPVWCGAGPEYSSPAIIDIDGDATPEIILGSGKRLFGWRFDGSPIYDNGVRDTFISLNGDPVVRRSAVLAEMSQTMLAPPLVSFIDGVGDASVVVTDVEDTIYIWRLTDFDQNNYADEIFRAKSEYGLAGPSIVFDRPGSLIKEIAFALGRGGLLILEGNARDSSLNFDVGRAVSMAGATIGHAYYVQRGVPGSWFIRHMAAPGLLASLDADTIFGPVLGDLDRDNRLDAVCASSGGIVWAFDSLLQSLPGFPMEVDGEISADPVLGDIDNDGYLEIILAGDNLIYAVNYNATAVEDYPVVIDRHESSGPIDSPPIIVGTSAGHPTEVIVSTAAGEVASVGVRQFGQPDFIARPVGAPVIGSPAFGYDPATETAAVFAVGNDGFLYGFALPLSAGPYHGVFNQRGYDGGRTNVYPVDSLPDLVQPGGLLAEKSVYAYPNPAGGDEIRVHYEVGGAAEIEISIYDIAGNLIDELQGSGVSGTDNEIVWHCGAVASGVYYCRVVARSAEGESQMVFCPVAIAR